MCGIAAVFLHPHHRPPAVNEAIRQSLTANLLANEARGRAATGLALAQRDGQVFIEKRAVPASEFVQTTAYRRLLDRLGPETTLLLGHTRQPTKGTPENQDNNHPLHVGSVFGVHNGHIDNDDTLFEQSHLMRQAQVDSEIIFHLLAGIDTTPAAPTYLTEVQTQFSQLEGRFTCLLGDQRQPDMLLLVKHRNPLSVYFHSGWQALVFSSRYLHLRQSFGPTVAHQPIPHETLLLYRAADLPQQEHHPVLALPLQMPAAIGSSA